MRVFTGEIPILTAKAATGNGNVVEVSDYDVIMIQVDTANSANLTLQVQGSIATDIPTWASAQSPSNPWDYIQIKDQEDGSVLDGDIGLALTGTDDHRIFEINVNALKWLNLRVTAYVAGDITVIGKAFSRGNG